MTLLLLTEAAKAMLTQTIKTAMLSASSSLVLMHSVAQAHDSYSARYVMTDELQEWVIYDEDVHGERDVETVEEQLRFHAGYYLGLGIGDTHVDPEGRSNGFATDDDSSHGYKLYFGRHFKPSWAWEFSYADLGVAGLGNPTNATLDALVPNAEIDYKIPALWIKYLPFDPNNNLSMDIKAGLSAITNTANDSRIGYEKQTSVQVALGLGVQLRFAERFFVRLDVDSYDKDATYTGVSLGMYFNGHDEHKEAPVVLDSDKDGVLDKNDQCPSTAIGVSVDTQGCALSVDSDQDGVLDNDDQCPGTAIGVSVDTQGCALSVDSDQDGVLDNDDQCPSSLPGDQVDATGCVPPPPEPIVNCKAFPAVVDGVNFRTNSAELTASAKRVLTDVVQTFKANPTARVEVGAHTDAQGSDFYNLNLSNRRAASVKAFLISLGVNAEQVSSQGYGESRPIADNATKTGRAQNRRVELQPLDKVCQ